MTGENVAFQYTASQQRASWQSSDGRSSVQLGDLYRRDVGPDGARETVSVPGPNRTVAEITSENGGTPQLRFIHDDHLGSTAVATDDAGAVERYWHSPFGRRVDPTSGTLLNASDSFEDRPRFTSHQTDGQEPVLGSHGGGFVHMRGREYDPVTGQFLSQDPMAPVGSSAAGWNPYAYVLNNPTSLMDPTGYWPFDPTVDIFGPSGLGGVGPGGGGNPLPGLPPGTLSGLARAWQSQTDLMAHGQFEMGSDFNLYQGFLNGLGVPGTGPADHFSNPIEEATYYRGQLIGSFVGIAFDTLALAQGIVFLTSGTVMETLSAFLARLGGPSGAMAAAITSLGAAAPYLIGALSLQASGAGFMVHGSRFHDAIENINRLHNEAAPPREPPHLRHSGAGPRLHGELPHRGQLGQMNTARLAELRETTEISLQTRTREMQRLGDRGGHGRRIGQERRLLRNIEEILRERGAL